MKLSDWTYQPSSELYLKYKSVYDNPKYYNQKNSNIYWLEDDGFDITTKKNEVMKAGTIFNRYGELSCEFLGSPIVSFHSRALAPHSEYSSKHQYLDMKN